MSGPSTTGWTSALESQAKALCAVAGPDAEAERVALCEPAAPSVVDGAAVGGRFRPRGAEELAAGLAALSRAGAAAVVCGGGELLHEGHPPARIDWLVETRGLCGIDAFEPEEGVIHARAGTTVAEIRHRAEAEGWELPLDAPGAGATLGGAIASGASGPRAQGFGPTRDAILGLEVVLARGERTRCGGRVVKNVTGFDLAKLYAGSLGTLGVVEGAWLRLRPAPAERRATVLLDVSPGPALLAESRRAGVRAAVWLDPTAARDPALGLAAGAADAVGRGAWLCEWAGAPEALERDARAMAAALGGAWVPAPEGALDAVRDRRARPPEPGRVRARIAVLPTRAPALCDELAARLGAGVEIALCPALGEVRVEADWSGLATAARLRRLAREAGGSVAIEALAPAEKDGVDCFALPAATRRLMAAIKERFDPDGLLSPGRFGGTP